MFCLNIYFESNTKLEEEIPEIISVILTCQSNSIENLKKIKIPVDFKDWQYCRNCMMRDVCELRYGFVLFY